MPKVIFVSKIVDFQDGKYFVDYAVENKAGGLVACEKSFDNSNDATKFYKFLDEKQEKEVQTI